MEENKNSKKKNRKYNEIMLKSAIESVLQSKLTLYMASKEFNVPWSTLKANVERVKEERKQGITQIRMLKVGRPFSLSANLEQSLLSYIIQMQELGFGLTVNQIRQIAFSLAETAECKHYFNKSKRCAGWNWWIILFTMPAHTSHILQPLDVGVFRPLKAAWRAELQNYKVNNPTSVPTRFDFHKFLTPVYEQCFTPTNIRAGFRKAGIYPINKNAVCSEAIAPSILSDQPVPTSQFSMEEIIIGQDYDVDIPQAEIIKTNYDPLSEGAINEKDASKPSIPSISSIAEAQIENSAPSETLQMECELEQVPNSMYNINTVTNNITIDDIPRPILQNKNKIEIHDILILPKWKPNIKTRQKRNVPKAQCLTPVATTSSTNVSLRHVRRTTFKKRRSKSERSANTTTKLKKTSKRKRQTNFSTIK
ncbi:unnamed protein product [Parnassius apollo]|uniref:(apollo) hypothetical protein n=1 Tax=Parnassius apollo TaxID=110799 RepID=A0A8S3X1N7_PARAO|nr:unnamed protein product [Parnassius apollo]